MECSLDLMKDHFMAEICKRETMSTLLCLIVGGDGGGGGELNKMHQCLIILAKLSCFICNKW